MIEKCKLFTDVQRRWGLRTDHAASGLPNPTHLEGGYTICPGCRSESSVQNEPRHEKTCFSYMRTTKGQISLRIHKTGFLVTRLK